MDFVQLREKSADAGELLSLARDAMQLLAAHPGGPRLLLNGRPDVAAVANTHGVHLTGRPGELKPAQVRGFFRAAGQPDPILSISCHTLAEVQEASRGGADLVLFGPVFGKVVAGQAVAEGIGLDALYRACRQAGEVPVLALGGVTLANRGSCLAAGAAGVAAIRLLAAEGMPALP